MLYDLRRDTVCGASLDDALGWCSNHGSALSGWTILIITSQAPGTPKEAKVHVRGSRSATLVFDRYLLERPEKGIRTIEASSFWPEASR